MSLTAARQKTTGCPAASCTCVLSVFNVLVSTSLAASPCLSLHTLHEYLSKTVRHSTWALSFSVLVKVLYITQF